MDYEEGRVIEGVGNELLWTFSALLVAVLAVLFLALSIASGRRAGADIHPNQVSTRRDYPPRLELFFFLAARGGGEG